MSSVFEGSWEQGKNPVVAAFVLVLLVGGLYYGASAVVVTVIIVVSTIAEGGTDATGFFAVLGELNARLQVPILSALIAAQLVFFLALPLLLVRRWHTRDAAAYCGYRAPRAADVLLAAIGAAAAVPVAVLLSDPLYRLFPVLREISEASTALMRGSTPARLVLVAVAVAVTPAICEETLFRGCFLRTLLRGLRPGVAVAVSGVVFALFHRSPLSLPALIVVGCFLGLVYQRSGSLYPSMVAHFVYNLTFITLVNTEALGLPAVADEPFPLSVTAISIAAFAAAVWAIARAKPRAA